MDRLPRTNKGKSARRWTDGRKLEEDVLPSLPTTGCVAVWWACWFNAKYTDGGKLVFDLTSTQLAARASMTPSSARRIIQKLTEGGVFATRKNGCNVGGRSLGAERQITFRPYRKP